MSHEKKALVIGATGIIGSNLSRQLLEQGWKVVGTSKSKKGLEQENVRMIYVDLMDKEKCRKELQSQHLKEEQITHLYFVSWLPGKSPKEECELNRKLFANTLDLVEEICEETLCHVYLQTGSKWYGVHVGPERHYQSPGKEDLPRLSEPIFYYDMYDYMVNKQKGKKWTWSETRPDAVIGCARKNVMNLGGSYAVYATILKELGKPLIFPGGEDAYNSLRTFTDAKLLAKAIIHVSTNKECQNQSFNVVNGDLWRYNQIWPRIAAYFGMEVEVHKKAIPLRDLTQGFENTWEQIKKKHNLKNHALEELVTWDFMELWTSKMAWDDILDGVKLHEYGFHDVKNSEKMFKEYFNEMRRQKLIP